jgi:hypothetical protein
LLCNCRTVAKLKKNDANSQLHKLLYNRGVEHTAGGVCAAQLALSCNAITGTVRTQLQRVNTEVAQAWRASMEKAMQDMPAVSAASRHAAMAQCEKRVVLGAVARAAVRGRVAAAGEDQRAAERGRQLRRGQEVAARRVGAVSGGARQGHVPQDLQPV